MAEARRNLVLVDGSGYVFRAFHALPELNNSRGMPVSAVYGFIRMLMKLLKDQARSRIVIVVTHRYETAVACGKVIVLADGRIVEEGPPRDLTSDGTAFFRMFLSQP